MRRHLLACAVAAIALLLVATAAQAVWYDSFDSDVMTITDKNIRDGRVLSGRIATPGMVQGQSWTFQATVAIDVWNHYAPLRIGLEGVGYWGVNPSGWDWDYISFYKNDSWQFVAERQTDYQGAGGWRQAIGASSLDAISGPGTYQVNFWFDASQSPAGAYKARVSSAGTVLWESSWDVWGDHNLKPTSIMVEVVNADGLGYMYYDPDNAKYDYYSYQGSPEVYPYAQGGSILQIGLAQGLFDNLAPVPEPASIIALAGGLVSLLGLRRRRA